MSEIKVNRKKAQAVIFDLDGVLVSTDELHYKAWKMIAEEMGITDYGRQDNAKQRGVSRMASLDVVLEKADRNYSDIEKSMWAEKKNGYYKTMLKTLSENDLLPGALASLKTLKGLGVPCAVGSASKNAPEILERVKISQYFDAVSCGYDTDKAKPDPDVFLIAAKKLGVSPDACIVVEDAKAGIEAAKRGNMKPIGVGTEYEHLETVNKFPDLSHVNWSLELLL